MSSTIIYAVVLMVVISVTASSCKWYFHLQYRKKNERIRQLRNHLIGIEDFTNELKRLELREPKSLTWQELNREMRRLENERHILLGLKKREA